METVVSYHKFHGDNAGIIANTQKLVKIAESDSMDFDIIRLARGICSEWQANSKNAREKADAIHDWIAENIHYQFDPVTTELYQDSKTTLKEGFGDCDDFVILGMALNAAVGNYSRAVLIAADNEVQIDHVYYEVEVGENEWRAYDATVNGAEAGWKPKPEAVRHYVYLDGSVGTGFFGKIFKELSRFFRKFEKNVIRRPIKEIKRFAEKNFKDIYQPISRLARKIRDERRRLFEKIAKGLDDLTEDLGPFGGIAQTVIKAAAAIVVSQVAGALARSLFMQGSGGINAIASGASRVVVSPMIVENATFSALTIPEGSPLEMSAEEWGVLLSIAMTILSAGAAAVGNVALVAVTQIAQTAKTAIDVQNAIDEKEKLLDELKQIKAQVLAQAQAQQEVILKLEKDIEILRKFQQLHEEYELKIKQFRDENNQEIKNFTAEMEIASQKRIELHKAGIEQRKLQIQLLAQKVARDAENSASIAV